MNAIRDSEAASILKITGQCGPVSDSPGHSLVPVPCHDTRHPHCSLLAFCDTLSSTLLHMNGLAPSSSPTLSCRTSAPPLIFPISIDIHVSSLMNCQSMAPSFLAPLQMPNATTAWR